MLRVIKMNEIDTVIHENLVGAFEFYGDFVGYVEDFKDDYTGEEMPLGSEYVEFVHDGKPKKMLISEAVLGGYIRVPCLINNGVYVKI